MLDQALGAEEGGRMLGMLDGPSWMLQPGQQRFGLFIQGLKV